MRLGIYHLSDYRYSQPVQLGLHRLFLLPQQQSFQQTLRKNLKISPDPSGQNQRVDLAGNSFYTLWFDHPTDSLRIESELEVVCKPFNPFDFIIDPSFTTSLSRPEGMRYEYADEYGPLVSSFVHRDTSGEIRAFVNDIYSGSPDLLSFLVQLTAEVKRRWQHLVREEENLWTATHTFNAGQGSCRDLAWMQMNFLGNLGLATRFVSGYAFNPELEDGHELHAWLDVFLPGAGWVGLDPSLGLLTDHHYVPLAFHPDPQHTLPVQGKYGGEASSTLKTHVKIRSLAED